MTITRENLLDLIAGNFTVDHILSLIDYDVEYASDYAERGYTLKDDNKGIFLADWNPLEFTNPFTHAERAKLNLALLQHDTIALSDILEENDYCIEWCDEWATCQNCYKIVRTVPASYGYTPSYSVLNDSELFCLTCIESDLLEGYLAEKINNPRSLFLLPNALLEGFGFTIENSDKYENGFHFDQTDDPEYILKSKLKAYPNKEFVFADLSTGQFDMSFNIYSREIDKETL